MTTLPVLPQLLPVRLPEPAGQCLRRLPRLHRQHHRERGVHHVVRRHHGEGHRAPQVCPGRPSCRAPSCSSHPCPDLRTPTSSFPGTCPCDITVPSWFRDLKLHVERGPHGHWRGLGEEWGSRRFELPAAPSHPARGWTGPHRVDSRSPCLDTATQRKALETVPGAACRGRGPAPVVAGLLVSEGLRGAGVVSSRSRSFRLGTEVFGAGVAALGPEQGHCLLGGCPGWSTVTA